MHSSDEELLDLCMECGHGRKWHITTVIKKDGSTDYNHKGPCFEIDCDCRMYSYYFMPEPKKAKPVGRQLWLQEGILAL